MPEAAIVYLSLFPMLWLSPFVLRSPVQLRTFATSLAAVIVISGIGFLFVPAEPIAASTIGSSLFGRLFHIADWVNLEHNYFPSLHVGMAIVCAIHYGGSSSRTAAVLFSFWAVAIAIAALLTRQHYIVDVLAGGALGILVALTLNRMQYAQRC
jgi:membrane-associated phospholipid phosphatase